MSRLLIVPPLPIAAIAASRGSGAGNLATRDPKEAWVDDASGSGVTLQVDLGVVQVIDTIFVGYLRGAAPQATWSLAAGVAAADTQIQVNTELRVPDVAGDFAPVSHALWRAAPVAVRHLAITMTQPAGWPALTAGVLVVGRAFQPALGREWGFGRQPVDTGSVTPLASGGFGIVEGARKRLLTWTFGDLSEDETDWLERIGLDLGESAPGLVIEDDERRAGMVSRLHYGLFKRWRPFERRNRAQTRWEVAIEEWV